MPQLFKASVLSFDGGAMAANPDFVGMPPGDMTVEFWGRTPTSSMGDQQPVAVFMSYASNVQGMTQAHACTKNKHTTMVSTK